MSKNIKSINKAQIISQIASEIGITRHKTKTIITELEEQILKLGIARGKVQIREFGSFRIYKRKSTTIKQIGTKKNRLIVPQKVIRFIATEKFKQLIKADHPKAELPQRTKSFKPENNKVSDQIAISKERIPLQPASYFDRVSKERFDEILKQRTNRPRATGSDPTKKYIDSLPEGKIILSILKLAQSQGEQTVNFVFENKITYIFTGKPRRLLGKLSNELCRKFFIERFDLENENIPQERVGILEYQNKNCGIITVSIHSLPTYDGSSVVVKFRFK